MSVPEYDIPKSFSALRLRWVLDKLTIDWSKHLTHPCLLYNGNLDKDFYARIGVWNKAGRRIRMQGSRWVLQIVLNRTLHPGY